MVSQTYPSHAFVGRGREVQALQASLDAAIAGQGGLVFITGEAGIGKTRLAREAQRLAQERGLRWLSGRYDKDGGVALQPYVEAVRQYLETAEREHLPDLLGPYAPELARAFPDLAAALGPALPPQQPAVLDPQAARQRALDGLCHLFVGIARQPGASGLVLFLDDLHWAPSMEAVHALARRASSAPLFLLGAYRDTDLHETPALSQAVLAMNRERLFQSLPLRGLTLEDSAAMLETALGCPPSPSLTEALHALTGGNPFFLEEMARYLQERDALRKADGALALREGAALELPRSIRAVVEERLGRLSEEARGMLAVASVIGEEFSLSLVREVMGLSEDALADAVDGAVGASLVALRSNGSRESYAFAHSHVRQALYDGIGTARRRRLHLLVGQAIERQHASRLGEHADALAHHFLEGNDLAKAAEYSILAGERAFALYSWERARTHFERALEVLEQADDLPRRAQVLERLVDIEAAAGRTDLARHQETLDAYLRLGDKRKAARIHRMIAGALAAASSGSFSMDESNAHRQAANVLLEGEPDSVEKALTYSSLSHGLCRVYSINEAVRYGRLGLEMAERLNDTDQLAFACTDLATALSLIGGLSQARSYAERAFEHAQKARDLYIAGRATTYPHFVWPWINDREWLERWVDRHREFEQRTGFQRNHFFFYGVEALRSAFSGLPQKAADDLNKYESASSRQRVGLFHAHNAGRAYALLGDWERASYHMHAATSWTEAGHDPMMLVNGLHNYARFLLDTGDLVKAEEVLIKGHALSSNAGAVTQELNLLPLLCELRVRQGRLEEAEAHLSRAHEILARPQPWRGLAAPVHLAEGQLAAAKGQWDRSEQAFARALETERAYGFLYHEARILLAWAEAQAQHGAAGNNVGAQGLAPLQGVPSPTVPTPAEALALRKRGLDLLDQAAAILQKCAAKKDLERAEALRARLEALPLPAPVYPAGLTQREVDVMRLLVLGKSNREIAGALTLTRNTVANHVKRILDKTGAANRTEAAAFALRHDL